MPWYMADARATHAAGISQEDITLSAKRYPHPGEIGRLIEVFDHTDYPVLIHCAAGADRTGLASAIALLLFSDEQSRCRTPATMATIRPLRGRPHGALDEFLDYYENWLAALGEPHSPERFRKWFAETYCPGPYRAELKVLAPLPLVVPAKRGFTVTIRATNRSVEPWTFSPGGSGGIRLRYSVYSKAGAFVYRGHAGLFARTVHPGESIDLVAGFPPHRSRAAYAPRRLARRAIHRLARHRLLAVWLRAVDRGVADPRSAIRG